MRYLVILLLLLAAGCTSGQADWPYHGTPMVGTNQVPIPWW